MDLGPEDDHPNEDNQEDDTEANEAEEHSLRSSVELQFRYDTFIVICWMRLAL